MTCAQGLLRLLWGGGGGGGPKLECYGTACPVEDCSGNLPVLLQTILFDHFRAAFFFIAKFW